VDSVLASPVMQRRLRASELSISEITRSKHTDTSQRWKVQLSREGSDETVRTKIDISRRNGDDRFCLESVPSHIVTPYGLSASSVRHYLAEAAIEQKTKALAGRPETRARDVFDLDLLLRRRPTTAITAQTSVRESAAERALELPYSVFQDQVLLFLEPAFVKMYDDAAWQQMQHYVVGQLLEQR
jgi:hypothetical protein